MASSSFPITSTAFVLLLLSLTSNVFNNLAAKHSHSSSINPRLQKAYVALQAWKRVIYSDPNNMTANWVGPSVCNYTGIYCAPFPNDTKIQVVAGIDLNHNDIAGFLPEELGLLNDLALLHLNSNCFCGILPLSLSNLTLLHELDISNNESCMDMQEGVLLGPLPSQLFSKDLDAVFVNNNRLTSMIPSNLGSSSASVVVFANNYFGGCLPPSIANFANTLEELLLINTSLSGCLPPEVGFLYKLKVLDWNCARGNMFIAKTLKLHILLQLFLAGARDLQQLNIKGMVYDDRQNCLPEKASSEKQEGM
ncbi:hypothetical protein K7X08_012030 [Anisodus acutangulus]|uniref:Leucine-rich repeat-containing N-terminal plant-type domain-containing protein n=1 Tax=Anisodus acutangulus TaxID=402998 RepID=A0A9Q1LAJ9_9SOLA|nr:hypothetical protein K7X08_012030 [Anisodus acutangulus]